MRDYYKNPDVYRRMVEYLGGDTPANATCVYVARCDSEAYIDIEIRPPDELDYFLNDGLDVYRSLWDSEALIAHLDVEYVNFDFPAEPLLDMERSFKVQQPVISKIMEILEKYGLDPLVSLTGRGYHFVWKIARDSDSYQRLYELSYISDEVLGYYRAAASVGGKTVSPDMARAFSGLALVMEYLACMIKKESSLYCRLPIELTAVEVGPMERGREAISIDISEYGDPLDTRIVRIPFTIYYKPWIDGDSARAMLPDLYSIPYNGTDIIQAVETMRDEESVKKLAAQSSAEIPDGTDRSGGLISDYENSVVREFHEWFYSSEHDHPGSWPDTYDMTPHHRMPPCAVYLLNNPNDLLLKPAAIELLTRVMLALDWHPRHIAGLIRSKYERDYNWGGYWIRYSASMRADFYTRIFSGLFFTGTDELLDFNCQSTKEKMLCFNPEGGCSLEGYKQSLLKRR